MGDRPRSAFAADLFRWRGPHLGAHAAAGARGALRVCPVEFGAAWKRIDFAREFVRDKNATENNYNYAWSELGFRAFEWLRIGAVGQRTRAYGGEREFQRGPFVQATYGPATFGAFWFNPGSKEQVVVGSIGVKF
jgi:hypothetical protein